MASKFQTKIKKHYEANGWIVINTIKLSVNGYPDLFCFKDGKALFIECKEGGDTLKNHPNGDQIKKKWSEKYSKLYIGEGNPMFGKKLTFSDTHKNKLSVAAKNAPLLKCPHCGKEGKCNGMKRWHFDGCKYANI